MYAMILSLEDALSSKIHLLHFLHTTIAKGTIFHKFGHNPTIKKSIEQRKSPREIKRENNAIWEKYKIEKYGKIFFVN